MGGEEGVHHQHIWCEEVSVKKAHLGELQEMAYKNIQR